MTTLLLDEKALRKRITDVYRQMGIRARPRYWKSGKRRGRVRIPGIDKLPFTRDQLWLHMLNQVGIGGAICPYCSATSRRIPNPITLADCVLDHKVPIRHGGRWTLDNLVCVCADCNNLKGHLSYPFFVGVMCMLERWPDYHDRAAMHACMRTHGVTMRLKFGGKPKSFPTPEDVIPTPTTQPLALKEDW